MSDADKLCVNICRQDLIDDTAGDHRCGGSAHGTGHGIAGMRLLHGHHPGEKVDGVLFDLFLVHVYIVLRFRHESHLRDARGIPGRPGIIFDQAQFHCGQAADRFQQVQLLSISIQLVRQFFACQSQILRPREHQRICCVHNRDLHLAVPRHLDNIDRVSGGKQSVSQSPCGLHKFQSDRGRRSGDAGDVKITAVLHFSVRGLDVGNDDLVCIRIVNAHGSGPVLRFYQSLFNGEGAHTGGNVAAVAFIAHQRLVHGHLRESVVYVRAGML